MRSGLLSSMEESLGKNEFREGYNSKKFHNNKTLKDIADEIIALSKLTENKLLEKYSENVNENTFKEYLDYVSKINFYQMDSSLFYSTCHKIIFANKEYISSENIDLEELKQYMYTMIMDFVESMGIRIISIYNLIDAYYLLLDKTNDRERKIIIIKLLNDKIGGFELKDDKVTLINTARNSPIQYHIPYMVTEIGRLCFWKDANLGRIGRNTLCEKFPDKCLKIKHRNRMKEGFRGVTWGERPITIPESVTTIKGQAFLGCEFITSVELPQSVTKIEKEAFMDCAMLNAVTLPDSIDANTTYEPIFKNCDIKIVNLITRKNPLEVNIYTKRYKLFDAPKDIIFLRDGIEIVDETQKVNSAGAAAGAAVDPMNSKLKKKKGKKGKGESSKKKSHQ